MEKSVAAADEGAFPSVPRGIQQELSDWAARHLKKPPTPVEPIAVALSGGADSVACLMSAHASWPGSVVALHVNHGLQAAATQFVAACEVLCTSFGVPLRVLTVAVPRTPRASVEAEAREVRYAALSAAAKDCRAQAVLLGQHADDQAETVLLALTRGAGVPGLAAMGDAAHKHGVVFGRPFLALRGRALRQWVQQTGVPFVEDPSNLDQRHSRNRIRHSVLPAMAAHFPSVVDSMGRSARHAAEAALLLNELAVSDLAAVGNPPHIKGLRALSRARQANVLRHWLKACAGLAPSTAQLDELLNQVARCNTRGHAIAIRVSAGWVRRVGAALRYDSL